MLCVHRPGWGCKKSAATKKTVSAKSRSNNRSTTDGVACLFGNTGGRCHTLIVMALVYSIAAQGIACLQRQTATGCHTLVVRTSERIRWRRRRSGCWGRSRHAGFNGLVELELLLHRIHGSVKGEKSTNTKTLAIVHHRLIRLHALPRDPDTLLCVSIRTF